MKITVLGSGGWGTALALLLNSNKNPGDNVLLWDHFPQTLESIREHRENTVFLPGVSIPDDIALSHNLSQSILEADIIVSAVPAKGIHEIAPVVGANADGIEAVVSATKGFDIPGERRISLMWKEYLQDAFRGKYAVLSGPSHAEEVARKRITAVTIASEEISLARELSDLFSNDHFRAYAADDIPGVELGGVLKNVMAMGAGMIDQLELGVNARSAYITRALYEMIRFGEREGAVKETFFGLSGLGDLIVTCTSPLSRNYSVGRELAKGRSLEEILEGMKMVAEGVATAEVVYKMAQKYKIDMPITRVIYGIIKGRMTPEAGIIELMNRSLKDEKFYP